MASKWKNLRLKAETMAKLAAMKARFENQETLPKGLLKSDQDRFGISLDDLVNWLVRQEENHRERGRRKKAPRSRDCPVANEVLD